MGGRKSEFGINEGLLVLMIKVRKGAIVYFNLKRCGYTEVEMIEVQWSKK